jgi:hypothetical protein
MTDYDYKKRAKKLHKNGTRKLTLRARIRNYFRGPQGFTGAMGMQGVPSYGNCAFCLSKDLRRQAFTLCNGYSMCEEHFMGYKHD